MNDYKDKVIEQPHDHTNLKWQPLRKVTLFCNIAYGAEIIYLNKSHGTLLYSKMYMITKSLNGTDGRELVCNCCFVLWKR